MKMKKIINTVFIAASMSVLFTACKKELELFPPGSIELSQSFKTMNDAKAWDNNLYSQLRGRINGVFLAPQEVQADQLNASLSYGNRNGNPHRWGSSFLADDYALRDTWSGYYFMMKNVNAAIAGYPLITPATPAEQKLMDMYKADAHLMRAWLYSELIIRFAKPYEPATAATDPGVPLVLTYNPTDKPARSTVQATYDQILADINIAKPLLATAVGSQGAKRFTIHSVKALEARVKLYMKDWVAAKTLADEVISSGTYPLHNTQAGINSMWATDNMQEVIQQVFVAKPNELAPNVNDFFLGYRAGDNRFVPDFIPSQWVIDKFGATDIRKGAYFAQKTCRFLDNTDYTLWLVNKYPGNPALFTAATTNYQHALKLFRVGELYMISAEAGARAGGASEADALVKLNALRAARGLTPLVGISGATLLNEVKEERFRELAFEGFRLWDLKRWHEGFTRTAPQNISVIQVGPNFNT
ncbi:MAG: RagB/SusD family nutrient uptake outer membrane protein, partial [Pedobacter sp.]